MPNNPWLNLQNARPGLLEVIRADASLPYDFYWGKDSDGRYLLILRLSDRIPKPTISLKIRGVEVTYLEDARELRIALLDANMWEVFLPLCRDIVGSLKPHRPSQEVVASLIARLQVWQRLLSQGRGPSLSEQELRGLFAELVFLRDGLWPHLGVASVAAWLGPLGKPQDFCVGSQLFEVKSLLAGSGPLVTISSPEQLWPGPNSLFLVVVALGQVTKGGTTIVDLVRELSLRCIETDYEDEFESRLINVGYMPLTEYERIQFDVGKTLYFEVCDGFPRLEASSLPSGIEQVRYALRLDRCSAFERSGDLAAWLRKQ